MNEAAVRPASKRNGVKVSVMTDAAAKKPLIEEEMKKCQSGEESENQ